MIHTRDRSRQIAKVSSPPMAMGHSDGRPKIIPIAELEKQTILSTIAELIGDKAPGCPALRDRQDNSLPQTEGTTLPLSASLECRDMAVRI